MYRAKRQPPFARPGLRFNLFYVFACCLACLALASVLAGTPARAEKRRGTAAPAPVKKESAKADVRAVSLYGQLPLRFEPNRG